MARQGDPALLEDHVARDLLASRTLVRLAYPWRDGTPRVVPMWFHWDGHEIIVASAPDAPKMRVLMDGQLVAVTIDEDSWPPRALLVRGPISVGVMDGLCPEYRLAAERYLGPEKGREWCDGLLARGVSQARIAVRPEWVAILDFIRFFPSSMG